MARQLEAQKDGIVKIPGNAKKKCASYQVWLSSHKDRKAGKSKKLKMTAVKHLF